MRVDARDCYQVVLVVRSGSVEMEFCEKESGLLAGRVMSDGGSKGCVERQKVVLRRCRRRAREEWPVLIQDRKSVV